MKKFLFSVLLLLSFNSFATCIAIIITKKTIYVASDSRSTLFIKNKSGKIDTLFHTICKIHNLGNVFYAFSGYPDGLLPIIADRNLKNSTNLPKSYKSLLLDIQIFLENHLEEMRKKDFNSFLEKKTAGDICQLSIFGFGSNGNPYLSTAYFSICTSNKQAVKIKISESFSPAIVLGFRDHLNKLKALPINKKGVIFSLEDQVKYEMKFHKKSISTPIDLLEITQNNKVNWVRKQTICN